LAFFRFNEFFQDLGDVMKTLKNNFQEQCTDVYKNWYEKILKILDEKTATVGVASKGIPEFLKCIIYTISITVRHS